MNRNTVDEKLVRKYRAMAAIGGNFRGLSVLAYVDQIAELIRQTGSQHILDYGAGRGDAYEEPFDLRAKWGVQVTLYDPAFPTHEIKPVGNFHGVICSDVLEHIPVGNVEAVLEDLFDYAERFLWMSVCCRPAKKKFDDGKNMHVTVRPLKWWNAMVEKVDKKFGKDIYVHLLETK